jgi:hypothetical protein
LAVVQRAVCQTMIGSEPRTKLAMRRARSLLGGPCEKKK